MRRPIVLLSIGQIISWGTLYYSITFTAESIRQESGWSLSWIVGAYSMGLVVAAVATPYIGRLIQRYGGRNVMSTGAVVACLSLILIATSHSFPAFLTGWILAGIAMAMMLYEAAFSTAREIEGSEFKYAVSIITIAGGLASTLFWPLTSWLVAELGWRATLLIYAGLHAGICLPAHLQLEKPRLQSMFATGSKPIPIMARNTFYLLAGAFALASMTTAAISAHAGLLLNTRHVPRDIALAALALIGPLQIIGRIVELFLAHRVSSITMGMVAFTTLGASLVLLLILDSNYYLVFAFVMLYGFANGVMTVVRASVVAELYNRNQYASALAALSAPAMFVRACGPALLATMLGMFDLNIAIGSLTLSIALASMLYWNGTRAVRERHART